MEPVLPGRAGQPPWAFAAHLSPYLAVGLTAAALVAGALGLVLALRAVRGRLVGPGAGRPAGRAAGRRSR